VLIGIHQTSRPQSATPHTLLCYYQSPTPHTSCVIISLPRLTPPVLLSVTHASHSPVLLSVGNASHSPSCVIISRPRLTLSCIIISQPRLTLSYVIISQQRLTLSSINISQPGKLDPLHYTTMTVNEPKSCRCYRLYRIEQAVNRGHSVVARCISCSHSRTWAPLSDREFQVWGNNY